MSWELIDRVETPGGSDVTLNRHGADLIILANGKSLMSSRAHGSEEALATIGCVRAKALAEPVVLIGGLGMGFTLRATLDLLPPGATIFVAELLGAVVRWNTPPDGPLSHLAKFPLADPRVTIVEGDALATLRANVGRYDAVLMDVDNGPSAFSQEGNAALYDNGGVALMRRALAPHGVLAVWSAQEDRRYEHRLRHAGFRVRTERVRARLKGGGSRHVIFVGEL